jgi:hypothetical protein
MNRRTFVSLAATPLLGAQQLPPIRPITRGPKFHWFGYYDKLQFDPTSRYALGVENDVEHRLNTENDHLRIGMVDTADNDRWIELGSTKSWSWHQTCMLQWLPGSREEVIWNDRGDGRFISHIVNVKTGKRRTIPNAIYALSPDAKWGVVGDFRRTRYMRPETGYAGLEDPNKDVLAPENSGVWRVDLKTGESKLILPIAETARVPYKLADGSAGDWSGAHHYFDHLLVAPDGKRIVFFQRWNKRGEKFKTRMFTMNADGSDLFLLDPHGRTSHFIWRDPKTLLAWSWHPSHGEGFYLYHDKSDRVEPYARDVLKRNGHISFSRDGRWLVTDTGPDEQRLQHPALYDTKTNTLHPLAHLHSPKEYTGVWRCDTTPRWSPDMGKIIVDSPHGGNGRQMYLIDISGIVRSSA